MQQLQVSTKQDLTTAALHPIGIIFPNPGKWYAHIFGRDPDHEQEYTEIFILSVKVDSALRNMMFPKVNSSAATALNISCCELGCITFCDDRWISIHLQV